MNKLALAAIALSTLSTPAFALAANAPATTVLNASVPLVCTVGAPAGGTVAVTGTTAVGTATALCNDVDGFTATVSSANQGVLKATQANNTSTIPYTLNIAGVQSGVNLASQATFPGPAYLTTQSFAIDVVTNGTNGPAYAGAYSDTITFSIVNN